MIGRAEIEKRQRASRSTAGRTSSTETNSPRLAAYFYRFTSADSNVPMPTAKGLHPVEAPRFAPEPLPFGDSTPCAAPGSAVGLMHTSCGSCY